MLTVQLAYLLRDTSIKVNSADPGYTATDLNGHRGAQTVPEGTAEVIRLALLSDDGPTAMYSNTQGIVPWLTHKQGGSYEQRKRQNSDYYGWEPRTRPQHGGHWGRSPGEVCPITPFGVTLNGVVTPMHPSF
jgi:hypothetical protein